MSIADCSRCVARPPVVNLLCWESIFGKPTPWSLAPRRRAAPQKALDFFAFDVLKRWASNDGAAATFAAAGLAGSLSCALLYPLEVARCRMTVDATGAYTTLGGAFSRIVRTEGVGALYRGLGPSLAAILPEAAITYGLHDLLKRAYARFAGEEPGVVPALAAGVLSAFTGQLVAFPLETISRRLQLGGCAGVTAAATGAAGRGAAALPAAASATATAECAARQGMLAVAVGIVKEGGPRALYRGLGAATLRLVPMAFVSFTTYESVSARVNTECSSASLAVVHLRPVCWCQSYTCRPRLLACCTPSAGALSSTLKACRGIEPSQPSKPALRQKQAPSNASHTAPCPLPCACACFCASQVRAGLVWWEERQDEAAAEAEYRQLHATEPLCIGAPVDKGNGVQQRW